MTKIEALIDLGFTREEILARVLDTVPAAAPLLCAVGDKVLIETPAKYWSGRVVTVDAMAIRLVEAAWVASTGRFAQAIKSGEMDEVEPCGVVTVACAAVMAILPLPKLPAVQK